MSKTDTGGPAYPADWPVMIDGNWDLKHGCGMTLLEKHADTAMGGMMRAGLTSLHEETIARSAYKMAQAMLAEKRRIEEADNDNPE